MAVVLCQASAHPIPNLSTSPGAHRAQLQKPAHMSAQEDRQHITWSLNTVITIWQCDLKFSAAALAVWSNYNELVSICDFRISLSFENQQSSFIDLLFHSCKKTVFSLTRNDTPSSTVYCGNKGDLALSCG